MSDDHDPGQIARLALQLRDCASGNSTTPHFAAQWAACAEDILGSRVRKAYLADMQGTARATFDNALYDLLSAALMMYRFRRGQGQQENKE